MYAPPGAGLNRAVHGTKADENGGPPFPRWRRESVVHTTCSSVKASTLHKAYSVQPREGSPHIVCHPNDVRNHLQLRRYVHAMQQYLHRVRTCAHKAPSGSCHEAAKRIDLRTRISREKKEKKRNGCHSKT